MLIALEEVGETGEVEQPESESDGEVEVVEDGEIERGGEVDRRDFVNELAPESQ